MTLRSTPDRPGPTLHRVWRLPAADAVRGRRALWWTVGPAGELAVLLVSLKHLSRGRYPRGWPGWWPDTPFTGELVTITDHEERRTRVADIRISPSYLALLPDSRFLLVSGRTSRGENGESWRANTVLYSASGSPEAEFCLGDDIAALVTDADGSIWTAYGDERASTAATPSRERTSRAGTPGARRPGHPVDGCPTTPCRGAPPRPRTTGSGSSGTRAAPGAAPS
ncbi:hypothetical protein ACIQU8_34140 [Streptomyces griseus]|uniref:hypothetical protein n=1 Tax=Streptomyces griseus TaxID=1911 RepID=UPI003829D1C4